MSEPHVLCIQCRSVFTDEQISGHSACPSCGSKSVPGDTRQRETLTLTHHEWRVLFMWAENWAGRCLESDPEFKSPIPSIMREAKRQAPTMPGLSLMSDIQQVANAFGRVEMLDGDARTFIEPEKKH